MEMKHFSNIVVIFVEDHIYGMKTYVDTKELNVEKRHNLVVIFVNIKQNINII